MKKSMMMMPSNNKQWLRLRNTVMQFNKIKVKIRKNLTALIISQVSKKCALVNKPGKSQAVVIPLKRRKNECS